ncbi:hypothetical protein ATKI12_8250 [Kitasatospora sp. Ki12]|uniref:hypothetical protein n=1 Tax=Kitasatospora xanthocidica TaxID=83382 RepID=UPI00167B42D5|nr:hypothetical protein [Kitasatospora xanthocidica]GHF88376.1 hypothetical protein GCM10018790_77210 [Kitasatospora xanthocidica]
MRAFKRVLTVAALTAPLVMGCAGLASAQEGLSADYGKGAFVANQNGAGVGALESSVSPDGIAHAEFFIWADENGVSGSFVGSGASWNND